MILEEPNKQPQLPSPKPQIKPYYPRAVVSRLEFLFIPSRGFIRVPEDFEAFSREDYFWGFLDQGYKARPYRYWTFWKCIRPEWFQRYRNWSLCKMPPAYCVTLLIDGNDDPCDGYASSECEEPLGCHTLWIPDRRTLRLFFDAFPLPLFSEDQTHELQYELVENLLDLCWRYSHDPSPIDYLYRFWPELSKEDQQQFLRKMFTIESLAT